jgi:hypothetical protein
MLTSLDIRFGRLKSLKAWRKRNATANAIKGAKGLMYLNSFNIKEPLTDNAPKKGECQDRQPYRKIVILR